MVAIEPITRIVRDERGKPWIEGTNTKVMEIVLDHVGHGWSADEIHAQHPHLSLGHIHAALAFYYDHETEFAEQMRADASTLAALRAELGESPAQRRLKTLARPFRCKHTSLPDDQRTDSF